MTQQSFHLHGKLKLTKQKYELLCNKRFFYLQKNCQVDLITRSRSSVTHYTFFIFALV